MPWEIIANYPGTDNWQTPKTQPRLAGWGVGWFHALPFPHQLSTGCGHICYRSCLAASAAADNPSLCLTGVAVEGFRIVPILHP
jgi:hypothetical protein